MKAGDWYLKLSAEQAEEAVAMYDAGMSTGAVARHFQVTRQAMWELLKKRTTMRPQLRFGPDNHFHRGGSRASGEVHDLTERAIEQGILVRPDNCEQCGASGTAKDGRSLIQAHHADYNRPLDVMWLCQPCHHAWHRRHRAIALAREAVA